jgi:hypothetical protein
MKIEADGLRRGVAFLFEAILFETTEGDVMSIRQND